MEQFFETIDPEERIIRLGYLDRTRAVYYMLISVFVVGALLFVFLPLFAESQVTPVNTVYFMIPRDEYWGRCVTYGLNVLHILNAALVVFLDLLIITIIWHAACKFRVVGRAVESINGKRLEAWIREHQDAISYANEVNRVIGPLAVKSTVAVALYMIVSGLVVTHDLHFLELMKFSIVTTFSMLRFLACSWAADMMTENAQEIAWKVYETPWINATPKTRRKGLMIIQRCQKPIVIHVGGFLSAWSLNFCGQVFYGIFTFFSTLRVVLHVK
ncbi:uncharacterized protein LOC143376735 [Andrena cerasifolii]|uniref:uncharacterized protein LOC143376735 n=1 Tax=Andrena cerasifolii TaxID=2819439 RepID=UPI0040383F87